MVVFVVEWFHPCKFLRLLGAPTENELVEFLKYVGVTKEPIQ